MQSFMTRYVTGAVKVLSGFRPPCAGSLIPALFMSLLSVSFPAEAGWYTATGRAAVIDNDVERARREAIDDAVRAALLEAGANVRIYQNYANGTLEGESVAVDSSYPVKRTTVLEEQRTLNSVQLRVRVFIDDDTLVKCPLSAVKKTVQPLTFRFEDNLTYAGASGLEDMTVEISHLLYSRLGLSDTLSLRPEQRLNFLRDSHASLTYEEVRSLEALSRRDNVQYAITGTIRSLALSDAGSSALDKLLYKPTRRIEFTLSVFNAMTGVALLRRTYAGESDWDYDQGEFVDLRSERFLSSAYGQRLQELVAYATEDILSTLQCEPASARILSLRGDALIISIGQSSGVKEGQRFTLEHLSEVSDRQGRIYQSSQQSGAIYRVTEVYPHSARLIPDGGAQLLNVNADDVVTLK